MAVDARQAAALSIRGSGALILVTVGTQFFDELIAEVDRLAASGAIRGTVLAQIGLCQLPLQHIDHVAFDRQLSEKMRQAELIITHAGTGSVIEAVESGRPFIAVVNDHKAGDHQREFMQVLETTHDFCWIGSPADLEAALPLARPARSLRPDSVETLAGDICSEIEAAIGGLRSRRY